MPNERPFNAAATQFSRPADTTTYAAGDCLANSTTAGSVTPLEFTLPVNGPDHGIIITGARLLKSDHTKTTGDDFRLHLWTTSPTVSGGDNAAMSNTLTGYLGSISLDDDEEIGSADIVYCGTPDRNNNVIYAANFTGQVIYGLLEATGAYEPASAETFDVTLEGTAVS